MSVGAGRCPAGSEEQHAGLSASFDLEQLATEPVTHKGCGSRQTCAVSPPAPSRSWLLGNFPSKASVRCAFTQGPALRADACAAQWVWVCDSQPWEGACLASAVVQPPWPMPVAGLGAPGPHPKLYIV